MTKTTNTEVLFAEIGGQIANVQRVAETGSTNDDLMGAELGSRPAELALRWADHQLSGRGRRGRQWTDQSGKAVTFSVALERRIEPGCPPPVALSLAAGVMIADVLLENWPALRPHLKLKWPNDLLVGTGKAGGILVETRRNLDVERVVIGCGLNIRTPTLSATRPGHLLPTGLIDAAHPWDDHQAQRLVAAVAIRVCEGTKSFFAQGFDRYHQGWLALDAFAGKQVSLIDDGRAIATGIGRGVDPGGALLIERDGHVTPFSIGELSARASKRAN